MNLNTIKKTLLILILVLNINTFLAQTTPSVQAPIEELNILTTNEILKDKGTLVALCRSQNGTSKPVNVNGKIYFAAKQTYKKTDTAKTKPFFITYDGMILEGGDCKYSYSLNEEGRPRKISGVTFVDLNLPYTDISNNANNSSFSNSNNSYSESNNYNNTSSTNPMENIQNGFKELVNNPLIKGMLANEVKLSNSGVNVNGERCKKCKIVLKTPKNRACYICNRQFSGWGFIKKSYGITLEHEESLSSCFPEIGNHNYKCWIIHEDACCSRQCAMEL